jgi:GR25 family glycosyltransferase involved in LPS biosynthesis
MLKAFCINLDRRADRWDAIQSNCRDRGVPIGTLSRFSASNEPEYGALGCAKSHVAVLARFLTETDAPYCLVLEDDFEFVRPWSDLAQRFNQLAAEKVDWDVLLLAGTAVMAEERRPPGVARVWEAQSTVGYMVQRHYVPQLLSRFAESIPLMERMRSLPRLAVGARLAIDVAWKPLQRRDRWYIFSPAMGRPRPDYSDIEQKTVNYDAMAYGLEPV